MQNEQIDHYPELLQTGILEMVHLVAEFEHVKDLTELSDCKFFLYLLEHLPGFKLQDSIHVDFEYESNMTAKVLLIKNVTKSLVYYHQTQLLRDVSEFKNINFVEMCLGNRKDLFTLIFLVFSAMGSQPQSAQILQKLICQMKNETAEVVNSMIEYSKNMGQQCADSHRERRSEQRKMIQKMESLENKVQDLEKINKVLQENLKFQKQCLDVAEQQNKKLKQEIKKLISTNEQLTQANQKAIQELNLSLIDENATKKKMELLKTKYDEKVKKMQAQIQKFKSKSFEVNTLNNKISQISQINKQIQEENLQLRSVITKLENEKVEFKKLQKQKSDEFIKLKQKCSELQIRVEELSIQCSMKKSANFSSMNFDNSSYLQNSDQNRYRVKQNLKYLGNQIQDYQPSPQKLKFFKNNSNHINFSNNFQIRTITERSFEDDSASSFLQSQLHNINQNQSIFIDNVDEMRQKNKQNNKQNILEIQSSYKQEIRFLTCVIIDLNTQLEQATKVNKNFLIPNNSLTESRINTFAKKVKQMFNKNIQL